MSKLLRGDFIRLFRSKVFWVCVIAMFVIAGVMVYGIRLNKLSFPNSEFPPDRSLLEGIMLYAGMAISVFAGIFVGADYSSGTIRNKHIMGHSRVSMYLSNLIICLTAAFIIHITYIAVIVGASAAGITDKFYMSSEDVLINILVSTCSVLAMTSVILLLCMIISSRTASTIIALVLSISALFAAQWIDGERYKGEFVDKVLAEGFTVSEFVYIDDSSTKGKIIKFVHDYIPQNQLYQLVNRRSVDGIKLNKEIFPIYSLSLIALSTTAGIVIFRKKDLK